MSGVLYAILGGEEWGVRLSVACGLILFKELDNGLSERVWCGNVVNFESKATALWVPPEGRSLNRFKVSIKPAASTSELTVSGYSMRCSGVYVGTTRGLRTSCDAVALALWRGLVAVHVIVHRPVTGPD